MDHLDQSTPTNSTENTNFGIINLIPEGSKKRYEHSYEKFMHWRQANNVKGFSENIVLAYFGKLSQEYKASTLWATYSMLKSTIHANHNINIENYTKVRAFLKKAAKNYQVKRSEILTTVDIQRFFKEAPDKKFLLTKVALIIALTGACGRSELCKLKLGEVEDLNSAFLIRLQDPKIKIFRTYTITGQFYAMCKRYLTLRPFHCKEKRFFLNYQNGKCTCQVVGIHKFGAMPKQIATFLNLPNPEAYTAHCFRRSSATLLVDGDDLVMLKRPGGWTSNAVTEGVEHIDNHKQKKPKFLHILVEIKEDPMTIDSSNISPEKKLHFIDINQERDDDQVMQMEDFGSDNIMHIMLKKKR